MTLPFSQLARVTLAVPIPRKKKRERMKKRLMLLVVSVAAMLTILPWNRATMAQAPPRRIEVTASRFSFSPAEITLKKDEPVVLVVKSTDVTHGLRFHELNLDVKIEKGGTTEIPFTPDKAGDFVGHCTVFCGAGHGGMMLTLHVVE
jgi:cytochrome c oxidase subunit II